MIYLKDNIINHIEFNMIDYIILQINHFVKNEKPGREKYLSTRLV